MVSRSVMGFVLNCLICVAGAGMFQLPFDFANGPPPQLPALTRYEPPAFPASLRLTSITDGYATMMFTVDAEGEVGDAVALEASHPAFVDAVRDALFRWRFQFVESSTVPRREVIQFEFKRTGTISSLSQRDATKSFFPQTETAQTAPIRSIEWGALEAPPERIVMTTPVYPQALRLQRIKGYAIVSFVIDATGRVRVPVVTGASEAQFGEAALSAVREWRFEPPSHEGGAVHVLVERSFTFGAGLP